MAKPTAQQCHALTTYFIGAYTETVGSRPAVNRNKARWGFESLLMDYTPEQARMMLDHYIKHWEKPDLEWFLYNYEKVDTDMTERAAREESAKKRRKITEDRLKEWKQRWQK